MIVPVRCFTCGKVIGHLWEEYQRRVKSGEEAKKVLDELGLKKYCCRQIFLTHRELITEIAKFK